MFHDAIGFSKSAIEAGTFGGGGADGSMMAHSHVELRYGGNVGLDEIIHEQRPFALKHEVSFGDFIQFAGAVGVANCQGAPRLQFLAGRANHSRPAPHEGLIPAPFHSADEIFSRMGDAGFSPQEVVALSAAHSIPCVDDATPPQNEPLDSTPQEFDSQFFLETLLEGSDYPGNASALGEAKSPLPGEFRIQTDGLLARDSRSACEWQSFITDHDAMNAKFYKVMAKLSALGQEPSKLVDCSEVIPVPRAVRRQKARLPAGKTLDDVEAACDATPFPSLSVKPGPPTSIPAAYVIFSVSWIQNLTIAKPVQAYNLRIDLRLHSCLHNFVSQFAFVASYRLFLLGGLQTVIDETVAMSKLPDSGTLLHEVRKARKRYAQCWVW
ncbi:hypothetical protein EUX98_g3941 [Antrodiella citrinella]|uniref:Peroxidase n=1 Tax=Antrodiella citrinella TaxID=2447956 RepID=A0A4S4MV84_9APHY|nr:hypothetical protein EUX98_g3941 [Antrodiella citrinella]